MSDIAEKILTRLGEIEKAAFDATKSPWEWQDWGDAVELVHPMRTEDGKFTHPLNILKCSKEDWPPGRADREHIALNHPEAILRRCAADRRVLERHKQGEEFEPEPGMPWISAQMCNYCAEPFPCPDVIDLAAGLGLEVDR